MKALTIRQPWAWMIATGHKTVEWRSWYTSLRGPIAIHAGANRRHKQDNQWIQLQTGIAVPLSLPYGAIVATAELRRVQRARNLWDYLPDKDKLLLGGLDSEVEHLFGFVLDKVQPVDEPVPVTGYLGFWEWPTEQ